MAGRESESPDAAPGIGAPLVLKSPPNWTAVAFFGGLGALHLTMATWSAAQGRGGYHMSTAFGVMFVSAAALFAVIRYEVAIYPGCRLLVVRTGVGRLALSRTIPFDAIRYVRVTLLNWGQRHESTVTIVAEDDDLEVPAHRTPRQLALLLAMTLGVRLVKIYGDETPSEPAQRIAKLMESDQGNGN
ncbi:MAG TPA: hypothetical protein VEA69_05505 [Tepidisphaeraceae bacterium]|nr:hypothetical protein [Tepidisphaeraceae bacterium]